MFRYAYCACCIVIGVFASAPMGNTNIVDTQRGSVYAMGSAAVSNSQVSYLHVNGSASISNRSYLKSADMNGAVTCTDSTIDKVHVNGPIKLNNSVIGDISCQGSLSAYNTVMRGVHVAGSAEMTKCSGTSCAVSGCVHMNESNFDSISIDSRFEHGDIYPMYITDSRVAHISVRAIAREQPTLHILAPQDHMQIVFTKSRGTVITDCPHMITVRKGSLQSESRSTQ